MNNEVRKISAAQGRLQDAADQHLADNKVVRPDAADQRAYVGFLPVETYSQMVAALANAHQHLGGWHVNRSDAMEQIESALAAAGEAIPSRPNFVA